MSFAYGATDLHLNASDLAAIETALQHIQVVGERYPVSLSQHVNR